MLELFLRLFGGLETVIIMSNRYDGVDESYCRDVMAPLLRDVKWVFCEYVPSEEEHADIKRFCAKLSIADYRMTGYGEFSLR